MRIECGFHEVEIMPANAAYGGMPSARMAIVNPNSAHRVAYFIEVGYDGEFKVGLQVDGMRKVLLRMDDDGLMDVYETLHHNVHGSEPRGLDPREGPTRLTIR